MANVDRPNGGGGSHSEHDVLISGGGPAGLVVARGLAAAGGGRPDGGGGSHREHDVLISGGGPTGLMLAGELALAGVDVAIVERRTSQDLAGSRGGGPRRRPRDGSGRPA